MPLKRGLGWLWIGLIALIYAALYGLNYWLPLARSNYTTRIWDWSQAALTIGAALVLVSKWRNVKQKNALLGLALGFLSALSHSLHAPDFLASFVEGATVWLTFIGGTVLFRNLVVNRISTFDPPLRKIGGSLLFGIAVAVPFAILNNLYFYLTSGTLEFQNIFTSALEALRPGISEETVFRFFVLALSLSLLKSSGHPRLATGVAIFLAVVPHSLNHLPDLFLTNAPMGFVLLIVTSLLFGLPMALLQIKRNFESAVAFHWFIDFARFLFGY